MYVYRSDYPYFKLDAGDYLIWRWYFSCIGTPMMEITRSCDRLFPTMGFPVPIIMHIYIDSKFCVSSSKRCPDILSLYTIRKITNAHISWSLLNPWPDHFCWNMLSYSGLPTRLHCPHSRLPGESHMSDHPLFSPVVFQWLCNQMQSAWGVAAVKL